MISDDKYTFKVEITSVAIIWFVCNTLALFPWVINTTFFKTDEDPSANDGYYSMSGLRSIDFFCVSVRSILSILITAVPNLWESYTIDQVAERIMPPSEADLETLTSLLKVPKALEYFMDYLSSEDTENQRKVVL